MKKFLFLLSFIAVNFSFCKGQGHGSCDRAIIVDSSVYGPVYADGKPDPQLAMQHTDGTYFEKPHSAVWFSIDIPYDTILTFDLIPKNPTDDLDFLVFKDISFDKNCAMCRTEKKNFCQMVEAQRLTPIRSNIARCDNSVKGKTGLSLDAKNNMEPPGPHSTYSKAIEVKQGERYYIVVDNYTHANGKFTLKINFPLVSELITVHNDAIKHVDYPPPLPIPHPFFVIIKDSNTKAEIKSKIKVKWLKPENKHKEVDTIASNFLLPQDLDKGDKINIVGAAKGYLLSQTDYTAQTDSDKGIEILLVPIKEHQKMIFHIEFQPGSAEFMASAAGPLNDLLQFMQDNPEVKILIKGYVNDPYSNYDQAFDLKLSEIRAKAVYQFLIDNNIKVHRLKWKGFSNKEMAYPHPHTEEEMQANRRVEVEIVK